MKSQSAILKFTAPRPPGFARADLLVITGVVVLLLFAAFASYAVTRSQGHKVACMNNLRRLGQAMLMYTAENARKYPPRTIPNSWAERIRPYYSDTRLLKCPAEVGNPASYPTSNYEGDRAPRTYLCNGFDDFFYEQTGAPWSALVTYMKTNSIAESDFRWPAGTILLGEKYSTSQHLYMDMLAGSLGNDFTDVDQDHHFQGSQSSTAGGSNYTFVDGSVRFLEFGRSFSPTNLWATVEAWRFSFY